MRWMTTALALVLLGTGLGSTGAEARGGNYRGPNGAVPPNLREPMDPTPPPPPPPGTRFVGGPGPTWPTPPPPPSVSRARPPSRSRVGVLGFEAWPFWYHYNREVLEERTEAAIAFSRNFGVIEKKICTAVVGALDPKVASHPSIRAAAYIALGKIAWKPEHVEVLRTALSKSSHPTVMESMVLALGLLRRSAPKQQFDAGLLDEVRNDLFAVLADTTKQPRTRGFAGMALGLLGDQPTRSALVAKATAARLLLFMDRKHAHPDLFVAGMQGLSLQPIDAMGDPQRDWLRTLWRTGVLKGAQLRTYERVHVAIALGRLGEAEDADILAGVLDDPTIRDPNLGRAALGALGTLGVRLDTDARKRIAEAVRTRLEADDKEARKPDSKPRLMDLTQRNLAFMTLARIAAAELGAAEPSQALVVSIGRTLQSHADPKQDSPSAYAALGLGWMGRAVGAAPSAGVAAWLAKTRTLLAAGLKRKALTPRVRGAYAVALGLTGSEKSQPLLVKVLADRKAAPELRDACARALGILGRDGDAARATLSSVAQERRNESLRMGSVAGIGLLADTDPRALLLAELKNGRSLNLKGTVGRALANLGDEATVDALIEILRNPAESDLTRAIACAALGMIGDPEPRPSLARVTAHMNWRTTGDLLNEIFSIL